MYKNLQILMINNNLSEKDRNAGGFYHITYDIEILPKEKKDFNMEIVEGYPVQNRFKGNTEFKRSEMLIIKKKLFPTYTLDQLFDDEIEIIDAEKTTTKI